MIVCHNCHSQDMLGIDNKLTQSWLMRVNLTFLSMKVVDTSLAQSQCRGKQGQQQMERHFFLHFAGWRTCRQPIGFNEQPTMPAFSTEGRAATNNIWPPGIQELEFQLISSQQREGSKQWMETFFPSVFRFDAKSASVCRRLCALGVKTAWSAWQRLGFATSRKQT